MTGLGELPHGDVHAQEKGEERMSRRVTSWRCACKGEGRRMTGLGELPRGDVHAQEKGEERMS